MNDNNHDEPLQRARFAVQTRDDAEQAVAYAVAAMRAEGYSWEAIAHIVGMSAPGVKYRYGPRP